jgi:hypothetical protein
MVLAIGELAVVGVGQRVFSFFLRDKFVAVAVESHSLHGPFEYVGVGWLGNRWEIVEEGWTGVGE